MYYQTRIADILKEFGVSENTGLTREQVEQNRRKHGRNVLEEKQPPSFAARFFAQFKDYMVVILLIAAAISFVMSIIEGSADYMDPIIILVIVVVNATIGVVQESKAEKALEALKSMSSPTVKVRRGGIIDTIKVDELVPGDIILLNTGDLVPADARLIQSAALKTDESALTGESAAADKDSGVILHGDTALGDMRNMVWATTVVTSGRCTAVVVETGMNTQVGKIAQMIITGETPQTPLQEKLARTGKALGLTALLICGLIFLVGIMRRMPAFDMFMTSISLAVAAIPEGLPAIVTIMLALGVQKMVRKNAIVRKLPAVETLGSATVICSDKTGTLTQNKMTVVEVYGDERLALELGALCNNGTDSTETAILCAYEKNGKSKNSLDAAYKRIYEIPFDSSRKMMSTVHDIGGRIRIITKGAPDVLLERCNMPHDEKLRAVRQNTMMAKKALRVLAVAYRDVDAMSSEIEENLMFAGLIGIIDPPREEVKSAVELCKNAGIRVAMITGDHIETATAIAADLGIFRSEHKAITGGELNKLSDEELRRQIYGYTVFARVTPEHKVRIVNAFQRCGEVVAMTGDGVNDAPALKSADIGCAMGISGTDVAKGAADMILTDDNFATIVSAVREGRSIYANVRKAIHFLLSSNIGEIVTIFVAILIGWNSPLAAIQLLWVNLVTDSLPAIALGVEETESDIMSHKPIDRRKGLFSGGLAYSIFVEGIMIGVLTLIAYSFGRNIFGDEHVARSMAFAVLSLSQLVHAFNMRTSRSLFEEGMWKNRMMNLSFVICAAMQVCVISVPQIASVFKVVGLSIQQWAWVVILSIAPLVIIEVEKALGRRVRSGKKHQSNVSIQ